MEYCVYITTYKGVLLPRFYIGSTSIQKIEGGYRGTVRSYRYKTVWRNELSNNPHLFETEVVSYHTSRAEAIQAERLLQQQANVPFNEEYINQALAGGIGGIKTSGNPGKRSGKVRANISRGRKGKAIGWQHKPGAADRIAKASAALKGHIVTEETRAKLSAKLKGRPRSLESILKGLETKRQKKLLSESQQSLSLIVEP